MLPNPLHPALVHFPIVLMFLLPLFAVFALVQLRRGARRTAWAVPVVLALALAASAFLSLRTGEQQEEKVESVLSEGTLHGHEEAAELFLILSAVVAGLALAGMAPGRAGQALRVVATVAALALPIAGWRVGDSGGKLVYEHGAASAYVTAAGGPAGAELASPGEQDDED